jgi:hypothetical protein
MSDIRFADVSEFQIRFDPANYLKANNQVIICRVHNGYRADRAMPPRMRDIRAQPFTAVGWYLYLAKDRPASQQVVEAIGVIGRLRPNEFPIVDHEEGAGNQTGRCQQALDTFDAWAGFPATLYSGAAFMDANLGGRARWRRPRWIASYPPSYQPIASQEPRLATWWQYSDRASFTGIGGGVDASIYHGTAPQFLRTVRGGSAPEPPPPGGDPAGVFVASRPDGSFEAFAEGAGGVWHRWQQGGPGTPWSDWQTLNGP